MPEDTNPVNPAPEPPAPPPPREPAEPAGGCPGCPLGAAPDATETPEPAGEPVAPAAPAEPAPAAPPRERKPRPGWLASAHCGKMSRLEMFAAPAERGFECGRKVIVRTDRGTELATVVFGPRQADFAALPRDPYPILRAASAADLAHQQRIETELEPAEFEDAQQTIAAQRLAMKLVEVEHLFGGEKLVFYFMADGRVDFRALVREMARKHRARIDFRQIGVRDEARLLAEYEHCGRPLCCRQFLRGLEPVTMRMAKLQKATLDPAKISGRCGRLMCCLRYEDETYAYLRGKLPGRGAYVLTEDTAGQVLAEDVMAQKVTVGTADGRRVVVPVKAIKQVSDKPLAPPERKLVIPEPPPPRPAPPPAAAAAPAPSPGAGPRRRPDAPGPAQPPAGPRPPGAGRSPQPPRPEGPGAPQQPGQGQGQGRGRRRAGRRRRGGRPGPGPGPSRGPGPGARPGAGPP